MLGHASEEDPELLTGAIIIKHSEPDRFGRCNKHNKLDAALARSLAHSLANTVERAFGCETLAS